MFAKIRRNQRMIVALLCAGLFFCLACIPAARALAEAEVASVVIVVDESFSMNKNNYANNDRMYAADINRCRMDLIALILGVCAATQTPAAIIAFDHYSEPWRHESGGYYPDLMDDLKRRKFLERKDTVGFKAKQEFECLANAITLITGKSLSGKHYIFFLSDGAHSSDNDRKDGLEKLRGEVSKAKNENYDINMFIIPLLSVPMSRCRRGVTKDSQRRKPWFAGANAAYCRSGTPRETEDRAGKGKALRGRRKASGESEEAGGRSRQFMRHNLLDQTVVNDAHRALPGAHQAVETGLVHGAWRAYCVFEYLIQRAV